MEILAPPLEAILPNSNDEYLHEQIKARAFSIFLTRRDQYDNPDQNWNEAQRQIEKEGFRPQPVATVTVEEENTSDFKEFIPPTSQDEFLADPVFSSLWVSAHVVRDLSHCDPSFKQGHEESLKAFEISADKLLGFLIHFHRVDNVCIQVAK